jgi:hypothetical protein
MAFRQGKPADQLSCIKGGISSTWIEKPKLRLPPAALARDISPEFGPGKAAMQMLPAAAARAEAPRLFCATAQKQSSKTRKTAPAVVLTFKIKLSL